MRKIDLTGQRFSKLIVLNQAQHYTKKNGNKIIQWNCLCDCGNTTIVRAEYLRSGHTKSCGCDRKGRFVKRNDEEFIGNVFGYLKVLKRYNDDDLWLCDCECGNKSVIKGYNLINGNTQSCGCLQKERASQAKFINSIGERFGKLTVIERVDNNRYNHICYKCRCDCGNEIIVDVSNLRNGNTNSCGCIKSKGEMLINKWLRENNINYIAQYSHDKIFLSSGRRPFFDFAIFDNDNNLLCLIEYQGRQHYQYSGYGWDNKENYQATKRRDNERRVECAKLNIPLYEIPYWELDNIEDVLSNIIKDMEEVQEEVV